VNVREVTDVDEGMDEDKDWILFKSIARICYLKVGYLYILFAHYLLIVCFIQDLQPGISYRKDRFWQLICFLYWEELTISAMLFS
jgi:hypothetical protein